MSRLKKNQEGSIVLEAAVVLPFFLAFVLALIMLIQITVIEIKLQSAVSDTTKVVAAHMYPVGLLTDEARQTEVVKKLESAYDSSTEVWSQTKDYSTYVDKIPEGMLPESIRNYLTIHDDLTAIEDQTQEKIHEAKMKAANTIVLPVIKQFIEDDSSINSNQVHLSDVDIPSFRDRDKAYLGLELSYDLKLFIPFFEKEVTLTKKAYERVWVGNTGTSGNIGTPENTNPSENNDAPGNEDPTETIDPSEDKPAEAKKLPLQITINPNPVQRGTYITVKVLTAPGANVEIKVTYPSGAHSEAKDIRTYPVKTTNSGGNVDWRWLISGRTDPGLGTISITVTSNEQTVSKEQSFQVYTKDTFKVKQ
jgi:hypothetical protein